MLVHLIVLNYNGRHLLGECLPSIVDAAAVSRLLAGENSAYRDTVLMNSGGALVVAGAAPDLKAGIALAAASIDEGRARSALDRMIAISHEVIIEEEDDESEKS